MHLQLGFACQLFSSDRLVSVVVLHLLARGFKDLDDSDEVKTWFLHDNLTGVKFEELNFEFLRSFGQLHVHVVPLDYLVRLVQVLNAEGKVVFTRAEALGVQDLACNFLV